MAGRSGLRGERPGASRKHGHPITQRSRGSLGVNDGKRRDRVITLVVPVLCAATHAAPTRPCRRDRTGCQSGSSARSTKAR